MARHEVFLVVVAGLATLTGCNGGGSSTPARSSAPATSAAPAITTTQAAPAAPVSTSAATAGGSTWLYPKTVTTTASGVATATTVTATGASSGTPASATAPAGPAGLATGASSSARTTGVVLKGSVPPDPTTGFTGILFFVGERLVPGSNVLVGFQGNTVGLLPGLFTSSEILGVDVYLTAPGDYTFTAVAPDGTMSTPLTVTIASGGSSGTFAVQDPEIHMVFPPSFDPSFVGNVWIMGQNFQVGATLIATAPGGFTFAAPLTFVNDRTLGWSTATPTAGNYTLQVMNPLTLRTSKAVTITVSGAAVTTGGPAPGLSYPVSSVASPFFGTARIFGTSFTAGATLELTDAAGTTTKSSLIFISSDEVWWMLMYPSVGTYTALVRNPDGQATPSWKFTVTP